MIRRRIHLIVALVVVSLVLIAAGFSRDALAAYFDFQPHSCGGG